MRVNKENSNLHHHHHGSHRINSVRATQKRDARRENMLFAAISLVAALVVVLAFCSKFMM